MFSIASSTAIRRYRLTPYRAYDIMRLMKFFRARMPDEVHEALRVAAFHQRISMNALLVKALTQLKEVSAELERQSK